MTTIQEFADRVLKIDGVSRYILVREDGYIVGHNVENPDSISSMMILATFSCRKIQTLLGQNLFRHLVFTQKDREKIFIFPVDNHLLGISQKFDDDTPDVVNDISRFLDIIQDGSLQL